MPPIIRVSEWRLRRRFNRGRYYERVQQGQLQTRLKDTHPTRTKAREPYCTRTQEVFYVDAGLKVARVNKYNRTDETLGASVLPDQRVFIKNVILYRIRTPPKNLRKLFFFFMSDFFYQICWTIGIKID